MVSMPTSTVEDYLKRIYLEQVRSDGGLIPPGRIAQALDVTPGTVTAMMKTLTESQLVIYEPYVGVRLTPTVPGAGATTSANSGQGPPMKTRKKGQTAPFFSVTRIV